MEVKKKSGRGIREMVTSKLCCFNSSEPAETELQLTSEVFKIRKTTPLNRNIPGSAVMPVYKDEEEYNMSHQKRGFAIIFNHYAKFDNKDLEIRKGSEYDVDRLTSTLKKKLGFDVEVHRDLTKAEIYGVLQRVSEEDHSNNDCLLLVCMTHGASGNLLSACDGYYPVENLWRPFMADVCPTLAGKPKLFFIQACRGKLLDPGVNMTPFRQCDSNNKTDMAAHAQQGYTIPSGSDILVMCATTDGYVAWLTPRGSPFIQNLCEQLEKKAFTEDLVTILGSVIRQVSIEYKSDCPGDEDKDYKKCSPSITNLTLMRKVKFSQKSVDNEIATYSGSVV